MPRQTCRNAIPAPCVREEHARGNLRRCAAAECDATAWQLVPVAAQVALVVALAVALALGSARFPGGCSEQAALQLQTAGRSHHPNPCCLETLLMTASVAARVLAQAGLRRPLALQMHSFATPRPGQYAPARHVSVPRRTVASRRALSVRETEESVDHAHQLDKEFGAGAAPNQRSYAPAKQRSALLRWLQLCSVALGL